MRATTYFSIASILLFVAMGIYTHPLSPSIPELQLTFTEEGFYKILNQWDAREFAIFKGHFFIDFVFLLHYGVLGYVLTTRTRLFRHLNPALKAAFTWMLPGAAVLDAVENVLHLSMIAVFDSISPWLYLVAGGIATFKWLLILFFVISAGFFGYAAVRNKQNCN